MASKNAVLIEYVADMHQMDLSTFSKSRLASLRAILGEIHDAKVCHGDVYPRNIGSIWQARQFSGSISIRHKPSRRMKPSHQCNKNGCGWRF